MLKNIDESKILSIFIITILLIGGGVLFWQKINNSAVMTSTNLSHLKNTDILAEDNMQGDAESEKERIIIHIAGEINNPGVYELSNHSRVIDAIKAAGGQTGTADLDRINLAAPVFDGQKIVVPDLITGGDKILSSTTNNGNQKINLNNCTAVELEKLSGIGPSKAASIIKYREKVGRFKNVEELIEVRGIGEKTLENIKSELTVW